MRTSVVWRLYSQHLFGFNKGYFTANYLYATAYLKEWHGSEECQQALQQSVPRGFGESGDRGFRSVAGQHQIYFKLEYLLGRVKAIHLH